MTCTRHRPASGPGPALGSAARGPSSFWPERKQAAEERTRDGNEQRGADIVRAFKQRKQTAGDECRGIGQRQQVMPAAIMPERRPELA